MDETTAQSARAARRSQWMNWIGVLVIVAGGLAFIKMITASPAPRDGAHRAIGTKFVALEAAPLVGTEKSVSLDDLQGKVTLVNFWMPNCPYCLQELPHLAEMHRSRADRDDFKLLSLISSSPGQSDLAPLREYVEGELRRRKVELPVYTDAGGVSKEALAFSTGWEDGMPATVVLDRHGIIRGVWNGYVPGDEKAMAALVDRLLEE